MSLRRTAFSYMTRLKHELKVLGKEDIRAVAGQQDFVKTAPLNLIYVADMAKAKLRGQGDEWTAEVLGRMPASVLSLRMYICFVLRKAWRASSAQWSTEMQLQKRLNCARTRKSFLPRPSLTLKNSKTPRILSDFADFRINIVNL